MARYSLIATVTAAIMLLTGSIAGAQSTDESVEGEPMLLPVDPAPLVVTTDAGQREFTIEVADDDRERSAGLMFRTDLDDTHGMLFVFEETRRVAFWMKNTPLPLDLVFIGEDGEVVSVMNGVPFSTAPIAPDAPVRFVLELNEGTAQKAGIAEGDRVSHPQIDMVAD